MFCGIVEFAPAVERAEFPDFLEIILVPYGARGGRAGGLSYADAIRGQVASHPGRQRRHSSIGYLAALSYVMSLKDEKKTNKAVEGSQV